MAFVFKSERNLANNNELMRNELGPGQYLPQTEEKKIKVNKEPFMSGNQKISGKINDIPGPGSYYHDDVLIQYLKNVKNERISEQNDKIHLIQKGGNLELHPNSEKKGFNIKSKRFLELKDTKYPGPGYYFQPKKSMDRLSKLREQKKFFDQKIHIQKIKEFQRIPTIPSKVQEYGFDILDNGSLVQKQNPNMYKTFSGEKGDTVGPGSYEVEKPTNWHKTGTEWSKMKVMRDFYKTNKSEKNISTCLTSTNASENGQNNTRFSFYKGNNTDTNFRDNINMNEIPEFGEENNKIRTNRSEEKNILKCRIINCRKSNRMKIKKKENFENVIKDKYPGPGYYCDPFKTSSFFFRPPPEFKQFFGSKIERFPNQNNNSNSNLGPGVYSLSNMYKTTTGFAPFSTKSKRFYNSFLPKDIENKPGPGEYTLKSFTTDINKGKAKSSSNIGKFGSNEKRFSELLTKWKYFIPGPGYYNPGAIKERKNKVTQNIFRFRFNNIKKFIKNIKLNGGSEERAPPIGIYNPDMIFTIDYKNRKKTFENKSEKVAFDKTYDKNKKPTKIEIESNIGPGYYYREKVNKNLKPSPQFYSPKNDVNKRWFTDYNADIGPGQYDTDNYYDWNKKSFNINFV